MRSYSSRFILVLGLESRLFICCCQLVDSFRIGRGAFTSVLMVRIDLGFGILTGPPCRSRGVRFTLPSMLALNSKQMGQR